MTIDHKNCTWRFFSTCICLIILAAALCGCGGQDGQDGLTVDEETGAISGTVWAEPLTQLETDFPDGTSDNGVLQVERTFMGFPATVCFDVPPTETETVLCGASVQFSDGTDIAAVQKELDQRLGEVETQGTTRSGENYDLSADNYYWHGSKLMADCFTEQELARLEELAGDSSVTVWGDPAEWVANLAGTRYPVEIKLEEETKTLVFDATHYVNFRTALDEDAG